MTKGELIFYSAVNDDVYNSKINSLKDEINKLEKARKKRSDKGEKRGVYSSGLPANYKRYLYSANKRGIKFDLSLLEFNNIIANNCKYCGSLSKIGIDRIDNNEGYIISNCTPCCTNCNLMKFKHDVYSFLNHVKKIAQHNNLL